MSQRLSLTTTPERSQLMAGVRQTGTANELSVQKILRSLGQRFTVKAKDLPGTPDLVNRSHQWAIFVHGCFWHAHNCHLWKLPKGNRSFWRKKFAANKKRDKTKLKELRRKEYSVLTVWQCELKNEIKVRRKLQTFLSATNGNVVSVAEPRPKPSAVTLSFRLDEKKRRLSRAATTPDGTSFTTRFDPAHISIKQDARSLYDQVFLRSKKPAWHSPLRGTVRAADLFSGCGGLSLGTREACTALGKQFKSVLAIDEDLSSLEVYNRNFNPTLPINEDIWSVLSGETGARLQKEEKALLKKIGAVDICLAGPPCQGHSDLNNHTRRKDKRNHLYERVARFAEIAEPSHLIIENVPNVVNAKERALDKTIGRLEKLGYKVDTNVVHLADLGVPQRRKRDVLVASSTRVSIGDIIDQHKVSVERTVRWAIADLARKAPEGLLDSPGVVKRWQAFGRKISIAGALLIGLGCFSMVYFQGSQTGSQLVLLLVSLVATMMLSVAFFPSGAGFFEWLRVYNPARLFALNQIIERRFFAPSVSSALVHGVLGGALLLGMSEAGALVASRIPGAVPSSSGEIEIINSGWPIITGIAFSFMIGLILAGGIILLVEFTERVVGRGALASMCRRC